jgi:Domain of unknown function (DUF4258)
MSQLPASFSLHALDVLHERDISEEWVRRVLDAPTVERADFVDPALVHALAAIPERGGRVLRVVYNREVEPIRVVTAFFDRAMRGKL